MTRTFTSGFVMGSSQRSIRGLWICKWLTRSGSTFEKWRPNNMLHGKWLQLENGNHAPEVAGRKIWTLGLIVGIYFAHSLLALRCIAHYWKKIQIHWYVFEPTHNLFFPFKHIPSATLNWITGNLEIILVTKASALYLDTLTIAHETDTVVCWGLLRYK